MAKTNLLQNQPLTFTTELDQNDDRIDALWFNPLIENKIKSLENTDDRTLVKLKVTAEVNGGKRLPEGTVIQDLPTSKIPYIRATDVKNLRINIESSARIPSEIHRKIQNYQLKENDIVVTIVGTIGDIGIMDRKVEVCDFTENVARIRVRNENVSPFFLLHYLDSELGRIQTERFSVGSLQYKLSLQSCKDIEVYLPTKNNSFDLEQQKNILNKLNRIFNQAKEKRKRQKILIEEAKKIVSEKIGIPTPKQNNSSEVFIQEIENNSEVRLDALYNNPMRQRLLSVLEKYPNKKLAKLARPQTNSKVAPSDYYRLVELEQIDEQSGRIVGVEEVSELSSAKILLETNSVVISKLQPEKGKIALVNEDLGGCVGSSELVPIVVNSPEIKTKYLWLILRSDYVLKQWEYELTGSSRMRIGPNELYNTVIPLPSIPEQESIIFSVEEKLKESDDVGREASLLEENAREFFISLLLKE